jgi:hypothetical protein
MAGVFESEAFVLGLGGVWSDDICQFEFDAGRAAQCFADGTYLSDLKYWTFDPP